MEKIKLEKMGGEMEEEEKDFEKIAEENMAKFKEAMDNQNMEKMLNFFSKDFTFLPTMWNKIITQLRGVGYFKNANGEQEKIPSAENYFTGFFNSFPKITVNNFKIKPLGKSAYLLTALDTFELTEKNGERKSSSYKFDQIWKLENGEWKLDHFLSAIAIDKH